MTNCKFSLSCLSRRGIFLLLPVTLLIQSSSFSLHHPPHLVSLFLLITYLHLPIPCYFSSSPFLSITLIHVVYVYPHPSNPVPNPQHIPVLNQPKHPVPSLLHFLSLTLSPHTLALTCLCCSLGPSIKTDVPSSMSTHKSPHSHSGRIAERRAGGAVM